MRPRRATTYGARGNQAGGHGATMANDELTKGAAVDEAVVDRPNIDSYEVEWAVDCVAKDTFLFASITNISEMGIFVRTNDPLKIGTKVRLTFAPPGGEPFELNGAVAWVNPVRVEGDNPNPGMGIRFVDLKIEERERIVAVIRTIAYLRDLPQYD